MNDVALSKKLSLWLRHKPQAAGLTLDEAGWTDVAAVLSALGPGVDMARLREVVRSSDKQRFELSEDGSRIRARQGHSVEVELGWPEAAPPDILYHGTVATALDPIRAEGLRPMKRHHVHLSPDEATAVKVGARRGQPVILKVRAAELAATGQPFYLTSNNVWLTETVPPAFIDF